ncbi:porin family protein [Hirschia baltica]|uniref:Outer membrane protein beta-barrel domain-containing protein n=1 Tax=Hirschia baltica (strain ATCC 49814 / DSM 5838 / IFAM 1418) TaxID=582402 RepID=C6XMM0_HIRBI|nr:outer membrane beta-barrel protein [Hirschia baltica]ACT59934.1 hypothetical protein Hbal_2254 [Hirschia baltica ATCC 49814]
MKTIFAGAAVSALSLMGAAHAQAVEDTGPYVQGGYSYLELEPDGIADGVGTSAFTARTGWQITPMFGVEADLTSGVDDGEFDYNVDEDDFEIDRNNDGDLDDIIAESSDIGLNYLIGAYGTAQIPINDRLGVHARAGYAYIDLDATVPVVGNVAAVNVEDSASGPAVGAGLTFDMTESLELRGDYTYYSLEDTDTHAGSVVLGYKF